MTVHIDTSALIDALTGPRRSLETLIRLTEEGHRLAISSVVLYEWLRGPRTKGDLDAQEALLPSERSVAFGPAEAAVAARLYQAVSKARGREMDLAVAASAVAHEAALLTLNPEDFRDLPGLRLI
ncbi:MAG: PIN domain-containing protein [Vicinamibacterales bacterium]